MKNIDNIDIKINIATQQLKLRVPFDSQDEVRDVEAHIGALYTKWRAQFPHKSELELMAMLTYQYASFYFSMKKREENALAQADALAARIGELADDAKRAVGGQQ